MYKILIKIKVNLNPYTVEKLPLEKHCLDTTFLCKYVRNLSLN